MAITQDEMQSIVSAVLSAIRTNSRTIDQLTPVTSLSDNDSFEINGGKRVSFSLLRDLIIELEAEARSKSIAEINKRLNSVLGENASEAIDNFSEILKFLDGFKDSDRLADRLTAISLAIDTLRQVAYQDITISRLNGWLAKRPAAIRNEAAGHMFRILHNGTPVATAEWYSNYSEEHGECLSGVMRLRGYGICRCENNLPGVFAYEPLHHPEYSEWEIPDAGDHWGTPVDVTPRRCECTPPGTLTPGEIDGIWSGSAPGPSGAGTGALTPGEIDDIWTGNRPAPSESPAGAFTPEDIDKIWEQTIKKS